METEIPCFDSNHAITQIKLKDRTFYLDCTGSNYRYPYFAGMDHGIYCQNYLDEKLDFIPVPPPEDNGYFYTIKMDLEADGTAIVTRKFQATGSIESHERAYWKHVKEQERQKYLQRYVNSQSPGAELLEFSFQNTDDISQPFTYELKYRLPDYPTRAGSLWIFKIPGWEVEFTTSAVSLEKRQFPVQYSTSFTCRYEVEINLPEGYEVEYLPQDQLIETPYAVYRSVFQKGKTKLVFSDRYDRNERVIPVEGYDAYKDLLKKIQRFYQERIFLRKKQI